MVRQLILLEDPYRGSTDEQDRAYRDLDRITCEETKNLWSFLEYFRQLATKSGQLYFPSTTEKLFAKLPPSLSKKIEESFRNKHPGLNSGVLPAIKFTHTFVSEMCKDAALAKELRDLSLCSEGKYRYNRKGFLEDDESSDDSILIVDPGWDDYCLQAVKIESSRSLLSRCSKGPHVNYFKSVGHLYV
ncbi:hypothetical protein Tco_0094864 [Tanacetum coccineum]